MAPLTPYQIADLLNRNSNRDMYFQLFLVGIDLSNAKLIEARLGLANLCEANLSGADLRWADLNNANLCGADLSGANLTRANLVAARYDDATKWPSGFDPAKAGAKKEKSK